ncbi:hypothetical protein MQ524_000460 [Salmonella enterica]|nr:hypothetical protein [Salmonella enterica]
MSKSWDEVVNSAAFSNLSPAQREQARQQYFNEQVAPHVPDEQLPDVERQFYSTTQLYPKQNDATSYIDSAFGEVAQMGNNAMHFIHAESDSDYEKNNQVIQQHFNKDVDNSPVATTAGKLTGGAAVIIPATELGAAGGAGLVGSIGLDAVPGTMFLAQGLGGSVVSQIPAYGDVTLKQTGEDMLFHGLLGGTSAYSKSLRAKQVKNAFEKMIEHSPTNAESLEASDNYLAASRAHNVAQDYEAQKKINPDFTLEDALKNLKDQSPDLSYDKYKEVEDIFTPFNSLDIPEIKIFSNPYIDPQELLEYTASIKAERAQILNNIAESGKDTGKIYRTALNSRAYGKGLLRGRMSISNDILEPTLPQQIGEVASDWLGFKNPFTGVVKEKVGTNLIKEDSQQLIKDLKKDNYRINEQRDNISNKKGKHYTAQRYALNYQQKANNQMINFLENGMKGKKIKINEFNLLIKDSQEKEFENPNLTKRFRDLTERYEQAGLIEAEENVNKLVKEVLKTIGHHSISAIGGIGSAGAIPAVAYILGRMAKASKAEALDQALRYFHYEEGEDMYDADILDNLDKQAKQIDSTPFARLTTSAISSYNNKDDKK